MKYTLRQLEVFLATAKYENISRAAESLAMSQSAASGALKDLEAQFDMQLFDRIGKRLQLNELGVNIRAEAQVLLEQAKQLEGSLQGHQQATVNVGATVTIGNYLAINILQQFKAKYSDIDVTLDIANTAAIAQKIINFELDIALIEGEFWHPDLSVQPWCQDDLVVFCAPEHPLAELGRIDMAAIKRADWILREQGSGTRQRFDRAMAGKLDALSIALELKHTCLLYTSPSPRDA